MTGTQHVLSDVAHERDRQDKKWGKQDHDPFTWIAILGEEFGEAAKAALHYTFAVNSGNQFTAAQHKQLRDELIQTAAVAVAAVEALDRGELKVGAPTIKEQ